MEDNKASNGSSLLAELAQQLRDHYKYTSSNDYFYDLASNTKRAAVLICLFQGFNGDLRVLLTKRSSNISSHSHEVSFPGGLAEKSDRDDIATALREAKEEINLDPCLLDVVARGDAILETRTEMRMLIVPVIALLYDRNACHLTANPDEVEAIFDAPLEMFLKDENRREDTNKFVGRDTMVDYFDYEVEGKVHVIHGITLGMLVEVASVVFQRPPAYNEKTRCHLKKVGLRSSSELPMDAEKLEISSQPLTLSDVARRLLLYSASHSKSDDTDHARASDCENRSRPGTLKRAAVLVCIFVGDNGDLRVILTERSSTLSSHSGEVALPGGKMEEGDKDEVATALREAKEEIGLDPQLVDVVCELESFTMKNGMIVIPVIGLLHEKTAFHPTLNAAEVNTIFDAPLEMFLKDANRREVENEWKGHKYLLHYFDYQYADRLYVIFALTAGILIETASIVYQRPPAFSEMKPQFWNKLANAVMCSL